MKAASRHEFFIRVAHLAYAEEMCCGTDAADLESLHNERRLRVDSAAQGLHGSAH